jgi:hypothetical protein
MGSHWEAYLTIFSLAVVGVEKSNHFEIKSMSMSMFLEMEKNIDMDAGHGHE